MVLCFSSSSAAPGVITEIPAAWEKRMAPALRGAARRIRVSPTARAMDESTGSRSPASSKIAAAASVVGAS